MKQNSNISRLGLGTVQFGLDYGISNKDGQTPPDEVKKILELANRAGIRLIDTAAHYGSSEGILGESFPKDNKFKIVTKTEHFSTQLITALEAGRLKERFFTSLDKLKKKSIYCLMIHNADDLMVPGGNLLFDMMSELKAMGMITKIGISVYTPEQIDAIVSKFSPDIIQLPVNLLDQKLIHGGYLQNLKEAEIEIHARSIFLQGALLMEPENLPPHFDSARSILTRFRTDCRAAGISPLKASLDFALNLKQVDYAIVGICSTDHLKEIIDIAGDTSGGLADYSQYAWDDNLITNPAKWKVETDEQKIRR